MYISENPRYKHFLDIIKKFNNFQIESLFDASITFFAYSGTCTAI